MVNTTLIPDRIKLVQLIFTQWLFRTNRLLNYKPFKRFALWSSAANTLFIAPRDITTADPTRAADIHQGYIALRGHVVNCHEISPFKVVNQNQAWHEALHEFSWLKHLQAANGEIYREHARALVDDWIGRHGSLRAHVAGHRVMAKRIIAWLCHSAFLLQNCDHDFYMRFTRSLSQQVCLLKRIYYEAPEGIDRLYSSIAIAYAALSIGAGERTIQNGLKRLSADLKKQVLPDGGHISRNPKMIIDLLSLLLPLRHAIASREQPPDPVVLQAITKMMPLVHFFRLGDGTFAKFNGMGDTPIDLIATLIAHDHNDTSPRVGVSACGYNRIEAKETILLMDTGAPPPTPFSTNAHAGCLSFELSDGAHRLVINCGKGDFGTLRSTLPADFVRSTAAHSTLIIDALSSTRFVPEKRKGHNALTPVLSGPLKVKSRQTRNAIHHRLNTSHDGYASQYGLIHHRDLSLTLDGDVLNGCDYLQPEGLRRAKTADKMFSILFHLHPAVTAKATSKNMIEMHLPSRQRWLFICKSCNVELTDSLCLSETHGPQDTSKIEIKGKIDECSAIDWSFQRLS